MTQKVIRVGDSVAVVIPKKSLKDLGISTGDRVNVEIDKKPKLQIDGKELYRIVFKKAAVCLESLIQYLVFIDGNKRTGAVSTARFLFMNEYELIATSKELENFVMEIAVNKLDLGAISIWLKKHSRKIKS